LNIKKITEPIYILDTEVHIAKALTQMKVNHATEEYVHVPAVPTESRLRFVFFQAASEGSKAADIVKDAYVSIAPRSGIDTSPVETSQIISGEAIRIGNFLEVVK
jgi:hypothetical protein